MSLLGSLLQVAQLEYCKSVRAGIPTVGTLALVRNFIFNCSLEDWIVYVSEKVKMYTHIWTYQPLTVCSRFQKIKEMGLLLLEITFNIIISPHYEYLTKKKLSVNFSVGNRSPDEKFVLSQIFPPAKDAVKWKDIKVHAISSEGVSC